MLLLKQRRNYAQYTDQVILYSDVTGTELNWVKYVKKYAMTTRGSDVCPRGDLDLRVKVAKYR